MMKRKIFQIDCQRIIFGTARGTRRDARAFVEAQVDRYFDFPKRCSYYIKKAPGYGYHFEVQEGSRGGSALKEILAALSSEEEVEVLVVDANNHQYRVFKRTDGSLRTFFLSDEESNVQEILASAVLLEGTANKLRAHYSTLNTGALVAGLLFGISFLGMLAGLSVSATQSVIENGYEAAIDQGPMGFVFERGEERNAIHIPRPSMMPLTAGWHEVLIHQSRGGGQISKLIYQGGLWRIDPKDPAVHAPVEGDSP